MCSNIQTRGGWFLALALAGPLAGAASLQCIAPSTLLPRQSPIRQSADVDTARLRARLDRDGDDALDQTLSIAPFTFNHTRDVRGFIDTNAGAFAPLHNGITWDTGTNVVIPATHPIGPLVQLLTGESAMAAHGLLVLQDAADAAGLAGVGDVLARAGPDASASAGSTVMLDGRRSQTFVAGTTLSFAWAPVSGTPVMLNGAETDRPTFAAPATLGDVVIRLTVSNGAAMDFDDVTISIAVPLEPPDAARGEAAYVANTCAVCHGETAAGVAPFPNIQGERLAALQVRFSSGTVHNGRMLSEQQIVDVAAWLATLP